MTHVSIKVLWGSQFLGCKGGSETKLLHIPTLSTCNKMAEGPQKKNAGFHSPGLSYLK